MKLTENELNSLAEYSRKPITNSQLETPLKTSIDNYMFYNESEPNYFSPELTHSSNYFDTMSPFIHSDNQFFSPFSSNYHNVVRINNSPYEFNDMYNFSLLPETIKEY